jgi:Flp pilus assembly pilin Flp
VLTTNDLHRAGLNLPPGRFLAGRGRWRQAMTEYVIILVAIVVVCIAIVLIFGTTVQSKFEDGNSQMDRVSPGIQSVD